MVSKAWTAAAAVPVVAALAVIWWLAVPRHDICAMRLPAPAGCSADRVPVAAFCSVVILLLGAVSLRATGSRWRSTAGLGLIVAVIWSCVWVLYT